MTFENPETPRMRARLTEIIRERSFQTGSQITLASGRTSGFYFDMKPTMLDAEGARLIAMLNLDAIAGDAVDMVGGLEMGAVPLAASLAAISFGEGRPVQAFFVRKQAKDHGTKSLIEGLAAGEILAGRRVAVLEDVTTTGGSALKAVELLRGEGAEVVRLVTVVDREEGAATTFADAGIAFTPILRASEFG